MQNESAAAYCIKSGRKGLRRRRVSQILVVRHCILGVVCPSRCKKSCLDGRPMSLPCAERDIFRRNDILLAYFPLQYDDQHRCISNKFHLQDNFLITEGRSFCMPWPASYEKTSCLPSAYENSISEGGALPSEIEKGSHSFLHQTDT